MKISDLVVDTPPHAKLIQVPKATALILTNTDNEKTVPNIVYEHWNSYYPRTQLLPDLFRLFRMGNKYPSIDKHGRIVFADVEDIIKFVDINAEVERRFRLLENATTSFILQHSVHTMENTIIKRIPFDYVFYDEGTFVSDKIREIQKNTIVPLPLLDKIFTSVDQS